jgi:hypothetical protein
MMEFFPSCREIRAIVRMDSIQPQKSVSSKIVLRESNEISGRSIEGARAAISTPNRHRARHEFNKRFCFEAFHFQNQPAPACSLIFKLRTDPVLFSLFFTELMGVGVGRAGTSLI